MAYAIGRAVGPAVTRNRLRRRLRALVAVREQDLPVGLLLIGASPAAAARSFADLQVDLDRLIARMVPTATTSR